MLILERYKAVPVQAVLGRPRPPAATSIAGGAAAPLLVRTVARRGVYSTPHLPCACAPRAIHI
jgi:hypothetical protein